MKWTTNTHVTTIYTYFQGISDNICGFGRLFSSFIFIFLPIHNLFTRPNDGWMGLCITLGCVGWPAYQQTPNWNRQHAQCHLVNELPLKKLGKSRSWEVNHLLNKMNQETVSIITFKEKPIMSLQQNYQMNLKSRKALFMTWMSTAWCQNCYCFTSVAVYLLHRIQHDKI